MMTLMSFILLMSFADLGLGIGLQNSIPSCDDNAKLRINISSTFFTLLVLAVILLSFLIVYPVVPWYRLLNVQSLLAKSEANKSIIVMVTIFAVAIPFSTINKVQNGFQKMYVNSLWGIGGNVTGLILLFLATNLKTRDSLSYTCNIRL